MISMPGESFVFPSLPGVRGPKRVPYYLFIKDWVYVIIFTLNTICVCLEMVFSIQKNVNMTSFYTTPPPTVRTILTKPKRRKVTKNNFKSFVKVLFQKIKTFCQAVWNNKQKTHALLFNLSEWVIMITNFFKKPLKNKDIENVFKSPRAKCISFPCIELFLKRTYL